MRIAIPPHSSASVAAPEVRRYPTVESITTRVSGTLGRLGQYVHSKFERTGALNPEENAQLRHNLSFAVVEHVIETGILNEVLAARNVSNANVEIADENGSGMNHSRMPQASLGLVAAYAYALQLPNQSVPTDVEQIRQDLTLVLDDVLACTEGEQSQPLSPSHPQFGRAIQNMIAKASAKG